MKTFTYPTNAIKGLILMAIIVLIVWFTIWAICHADEIDNFCNTVLR